MVVADWLAAKDYVVEIGQSIDTGDDRCTFIVLTERLSESQVIIQANTGEYRLLENKDFRPGDDWHVKLFEEVGEEKLTIEEVMSLAKYWGSDTQNNNFLQDLILSTRGKRDEILKRGKYAEKENDEEESSVEKVSEKDL